MAQVQSTSESTNSTNGQILAPSATERFGFDTPYQETILLRESGRSSQSVLVNVKLTIRPTISKVITSIMPFVGGAVVNQIGASQNGDVRNKQLPYLAIGGGLSAVMLEKVFRKRQAYLQVKYRDSDTGQLNWYGCWIKNKQEASLQIPINDKSGILEVVIQPMKGTKVSVDALEYRQIVNDSQKENVSVNLSAMGGIGQPLPDDGGTNLVPSDGAGGGSGIWLDEVVVTAKGYGFDSNTWGSIVNQYGGGGPQPLQPILTIGTTQYDFRAIGYYVRPITPPTKAALQYSPVHFDNMCGALGKIWEYSYDPSNKKEIAGYVLDDGTFLALPWNDNFPDKCVFPTNGLINGPSGTNIGYRFWTENNCLKVDIIDYARRQSKTLTVTQYIHTHPFDDGSHDSYNPTAEFERQPWGDWQLSHDYGIPGIIIAPNGKLIQYKFRGDLSNHRFQNGVQSWDNYCTPEP